MTTDISGFGLVITLVADVTFPAGIVLSEFADDTDPLDSAAINIGETAMGLNGDMVSWGKAIPIPCTIAVIPGSDDDRNLAILADANRPSQGKNRANDNITINITYPDGSTANLSQGKITSYMALNSVASAGRKKSKPYIFMFQGLNRT